MSVLIKGMDMPTACSKCDCGNGDYGFCQITRDSWWHIDPSTERMENCPLIPIPDHGDLIDRDALMSEIADWQLTESPEEGRNWWLGKDVTSHEMQYCIYRLLGDVYEEVGDIPVVIPAERSEE